jgi:hypothetical protein
VKSSGVVKGVLAGLAVAIVGVLVVVTLSNRGSSSKPAAAAPADPQAQTAARTHIKTLAKYWDPAHPPQDDVWRRTVSCTTQPGGAAVAAGTVLNHTGQSAAYLVTVEFRRGGTVVATSSDGVVNVKPGQTAAWRAIATASQVDAAKGALSCAVTAVWRWDHGSTVPSG